MRFPFRVGDKRTQRVFDYISSALKFGRMIGGTASGAGTGATFIDYVITDNLGTTNKNGTGSQHDGGTFVTDITVVRVTATTADTTTFRAQPRLGGVIGAGLTVRIDYLIWID